MLVKALLVTIFALNCALVSAMDPSPAVIPELDRVWNHHQIELSAMLDALSSAGRAHYRYQEDRQARRQALQLARWIVQPDTVPAIHYGLARERSIFQGAIAEAETAIEATGYASVLEWHTTVVAKLSRLHQLFASQQTKTFALKRFLLSRYAGSGDSFRYLNFWWLQSTYADHLDRLALLSKEFDTKYQNRIVRWNVLHRPLRGALTRHAARSHRLTGDGGASSPTTGVLPPS
ncbi:uncharacterized protein PFL1_01471 [Pseudozyma flocculosa PF-1]|uniref:Uncharacterized protein n=1 Tax=Pseudozyma flocculosa TaxID=84751 RepID=A0A5C3FDN8_9BASI|nr:uncharacterized protein PFL1_01471 [Pseudozyma flocculosa PF-1]EPQ31286.1 hypothetical protein PFL1_01471 [Pseudozyma flocculosa PF-1]SPO41747.1 uncharacterized protein PSFLO_07229 [Pseudozyma flocculosa]